jgi:hypothetical protein
MLQQPTATQQEQQTQQDFGFCRNSIARLPKYTISHLAFQAEFFLHDSAVHQLEISPHGMIFWNK